MSRQLKKEKLIVALRKTSGPLQASINRYHSALDAMREKVEEIKERGKISHVLVLVEDLEGNRSIQRVHLPVTGENLAKIQSGKKKLMEWADEKRIWAGLGGEQFCKWSGDRGIHLDNLGTIERMGRIFLEALAERLEIAPGEIAGRLDAYIGIAEEGINIERMSVHTHLACMRLEIPAPSQADVALGTPLFIEISKRLEGEKCAVEVGALSKIPEEDVARELLKLLHPKKYEKYLIRCLPKQVQAGEVPGRKGPVFSEKHSELAGRLLREYPDLEFSGEYIQELGDSCRWGIEKAVCVHALELYGMHRKDAFFLVETGLSEEVVQKHTLVDSVLGFRGMVHSEVYSAFQILSEGQCWNLGEKLDEYLKWVSLMPGEWWESDKQELGALLALSISPPEKREDVRTALEGGEEEFLEQLIEAEGETDGVWQAYGEYVKYAERFVQGEALEDAREKGVEQPAPRAEAKRPHETLEFPEEADAYIESKGISPEDVKRTLVYGLRLTSSKAAMGGKYFPVPAFQKNVRGVLTAETAGLDAIEGFLYREGVLSYYKNDDVVMLNLKDEIGRHNEPSPAGRQILNSIIGWKVEFDKKTKGNGGAQSET